MEKRNFVTSFRTPEENFSTDELIDSAAKAFGGKTAEKPSRFEKTASCEDEKADAE